MSGVTVVLHIRKWLHLSELISPLIAQLDDIQEIIIHFSGPTDYGFITDSFKYGFRIYAYADKDCCRAEIVNLANAIHSKYLLIIDQDRIPGKTVVKEFVAMAEKHPGYALYGYWGWKLGPKINEGSQWECLPNAVSSTFHTNTLTEVDYLCGVYFGETEVFRKINSAEKIWPEHSSSMRALYDDIFTCLSANGRCLVVPLGPQSFIYKPENSVEGPDCRQLRSDTVKKFIDERDYKVVVLTSINEKKFDNNDGVTVVITSCGRPFLLEITLFTFLKFNRYPISQVIVSEDSGVPGINGPLEVIYPNITWIKTSVRRGQILSIDSAYALVQTPYIFHLEEDWIFYRSGVIEESMAILKAAEAEDVKISAVMCRAHGDGGNTLEDPTKSIPILKCSRDDWGYFAFNPGLRRTKDYHEIFKGAYSNVTAFDRMNPSKSESDINQIYKKLGYRMAITREPDGYCKHIGNEYHVF